MSARTTPDFTLMFVVGISLFGCLTTITLALYQRQVLESSVWRKPLIGSVFALTCTSGIIAVFYPRKCSETFYMQDALKPIDSGTKDTSFGQEYIVLMGHHPSCGRFFAHTVHIGGRALCAACTGLLCGGIAAFAGTILYFFGGQNLGHMGLWAVLVGQVGILLGLVQFKFSGYARLTANAFFVFAAFLTLVGVDALVSNIFIDIYVVVLIVFWLWTRIAISQWDHRRICCGCPRPCGG